MNLRQAAQQALEALERGETKLRWAAITALRQALAEPEQEPVAWRLYKDGELYAIKYEKEDRGSHYTWEPLYTAPTPRKRLTDGEIIEHFEAEVDTGLLSSFADGVRFAERAHGIGEGQ